MFLGKKKDVDSKADPRTRFLANSKIICIENMKRFKIYHETLEFTFDALKNDFVL